MREKWSKPAEPRVSDGHPVPQKIAYREQTYKPKLQYSPSLRAIKIYNDLPVEGEGTIQRGIDLSYFESDNKYNNKNYEEPYTYVNSPESESYMYDYATMGTLSLKTTNSAGSELNSEINEMGSTVKLVSPKMGKSCHAWCSRISTVICTVSMAAGIGNLYRLPQTTLIRGGLPFLVVYIVLTILIGLPLLFLELGIGQLAEEGFIKSWRAVPFFRGIGYVKLVAGYMLSVYYPLYIGLAIYYIIWVLKGPFPFKECSAGVKITENGYSIYGKNGQQCLRATFLKSPFEDPFWFGIFAAIMFLVWTIIVLLSIKITRSYIRSLVILFFPTITCYILLIVKSVLHDEEFDGLRNFVDNADWNILKKADVWYYACIQVFFSTYVGFGSFITNAGIIYHKVNPLWTALGYIIVNILLGSGSIVMSHILTGNINATANNGDVAELHLIALIYDVGKNSTKDDIKWWIILAYLVIILAGFINMATLMYTILKATKTLSINRLNWWQTSLILSFMGFVLGCCVLLQTDFDIVHLFDHYIVGNLILITVILEVFALITFYGTERIKSDFEFMLGHILSKIWLILWWVLPLLLTAIFAWAMITLPLEGIFKDDPAWLYGIGWGVVLTAFVFIFITGFYIVSKQDGYTIYDKFKTSLKTSHNWGPKDPMSRHNWVQWNSMAQNGERDFTLKRKGTRDYTRSIKKNAKKPTSDLSTSLAGVYNTNQNVRNSTDSNNYTELYNLPAEQNLTLEIRKNQSSPSSPSSPSRNPLRVTSLIDSFDPVNFSYKPSHNSFPISNSTTNDPRNLNIQKEPQDTSTNIEYGTFRKGPYIINEDVIEHVCYRRFSENTTEL